MSREFIREDYLRLELEFMPLLPAREIAIAYLSELDFEVFESTDSGLIAHISTNKVDNDELQSVKAQLEGIAQSVIWTESNVKTENWNAKWEEDYDAVNVDDLALVRAPFHNPLKTGLDVVIKPNMSFGTGHHDTTWMMIRSLLDLNISNSKVLDMGCGTGVLAITAYKLGASSVLAIDIEDGAIRNTIENAALNSIEISDKFYVDCGTSELLTTKHFNLNQIILANINRNVLIDDMPAYNKVLDHGGITVFSGFFTGDVPIMKEQIEGMGWVIDKVLDRNGWACIICGKPAI